MKKGARDLEVSDSPLNIVSSTRTMTKIHTFFLNMATPCLHKYSCFKMGCISIRADKSNVQGKEMRNSVNNEVTKTKNYQAMSFLTTWSRHTGLRPSPMVTLASTVNGESRGYQYLNT